MKKIIFAAIAAISLASCGVNYEKSPSGLVYKIFPGKGGDSIKAGYYIKYDVQFYLTGRTGKQDSLLNPPSVMPQYLQVDTSKRAEYSFMEIMPKLKAGDSAVAILNVDTLKNRHVNLDSTVFTKGSSIECRLKVFKSFKEEKDVMADYEKESKAEEAREVKVVEDYLASKNLKGIKTKNGAYVVLDNPGDASLKADSGKIASVKYKGYLMSDNSKVFDTNMDSSKGHTEPYDVPVGRHGVIQGWDEALPYFGKGGTGKIYIPAFLAYGPQGNGPDLPPNANLIFDIQIVDVKDAPSVQERDPRQMIPGHR
ncbi:hypothetical protein FRZ67_00790 [Panacibacter ginsenosidivorans]|uniref:Peptidyl-prolyl cis-trans isomerase n=1 Tax=Panacibacter ginsenosidivorans TaxID=1813871 RepID=A0A5B8V5M2_9BACT|nr:FKBP-type peptidyl-prolyl cis-trans isomerase [Panacibacter ginsenosidivorans]QEC65906.1 hypothetical protein FRZ67_00790 [Panacibacter ginsenosidivorans]